MGVLIGQHCLLLHLGVELVALLTGSLVGKLGLHSLPDIELLRLLVELLIGVALAELLLAHRGALASELAEVVHACNDKVIVEVGFLTALEFLEEPGAGIGLPTALLIEAPSQRFVGGLEDAIAHGLHVLG